MFKNNPLPFALVFFVLLFAGVSLFSGGKSDGSSSRTFSREWHSRSSDAGRPAFSGTSREMPDVTGVTEVEFSVPCTLVLSQGDAESLTVSPALDTDEIEVEVIGNKLRIRIRDSWINLSHRDYVFTLQVKNLTNLSASAASMVEASALSSDSFYLSASGASDVDVSSITAQSAEYQVSGSSTLELDGCDARRLSLGCSGAGVIRIDQCASDDIRAIVSGSSSVSLEGSIPVAKVDLNLSGASDFDSDHLSAKAFSAMVSGGSDADIAVSDSLYARVSGAGELHYLGSPTLDSETSGGGSVSRK